MTSVRAAGLSDLGQVRANNEDSSFVDPQGRLFLVADGMGGHAGGEVASDIVARAAAAAAAGAGGWADPARELEAMLERADAEVRLRASGALHGMGSTAVALYLRDGRAWIAHTGDSRAYRWRAGRLDRLTVDHTPEMELGLQGSRSGLLTRAIGIGDDPACDLDEADAAPGDRFLLCSDGLTDMVGDLRIAGVLASGQEPTAMARDLIEAANAAGGRDNVTAVVVAVE